ncbi:NAD(P)/FAD-dependent oxidoreductase [Kutzneria buriramensis]|uniref:2-polyprenyl-6-methoxyphenol hydroxylase-like FAD-dependent oxidoreductase n=1 Tax=Kutzneria buriramensis TaxID=1045776 RepID=A0A3E0HI43_9PSEU|nr:NAD(P)/FAD-dependent oxidoreductase [Kutzneria buriramensis]REH46111.1 2-polyprenyl-6-methoxyphenol hydroxylase-like FAD-dependent oxidoreductase [Kutzneria buriramensis]
MRILIIGGGIGGLAMAQALAAADVDVHVYERNNEATDWLQGYRIQLNLFGCRALRRCLPAPLWDAFAATAGDPGAGMSFQTHRLREMLFVEQELMTGGTGEHRAVSRIALRRLLLAGIADNVHFGHACERYETNADGTVTAHFANGATATGDLLIGADGANSLVRSQLLPQAHRVLTGQMGVAGQLALTDETRAWLPNRIQGGLNIVLPPAGSFLFSAVFNGRSRTTDAIGDGLDLSAYGLTGAELLDDVQDYVLWAFAAKRADYPLDADTMPGPALQRLVADCLRGWHPDLIRMITESSPDTVHAIEFKAATPVQAWPTGPVTLIGDAVHNMTPVMGLGANTALRDAALLAHQIKAVHRGECDLLAAVSQYERRMLAYGFEAVNTSCSFAHRFTSDNVLARQGMKTWLRLCGAVPAVKRGSFIAKWTDDLPAAV